VDSDSEAESDVSQSAENISTKDEHMKSLNNEVWLDDPLPLFKVLEDKCAFDPTETPLS